MCLMLQKTRFQDQVLKPCKYVQESSEEVLDFKPQQSLSKNQVKKCWILKLNS